MEKKWKPIPIDKIDKNDPNYLMCIYQAVKKKGKFKGLIHSKKYKVPFKYVKDIETGEIIRKTDHEKAEIIREKQVKEIEKEFFKALNLGYKPYGKVIYR